jgi:hypothetical protein
MPRLSQSELKEKVGILAANGRLPEAQEVIVGVGYNIVMLETLAALLQSW